MKPTKKHIADKALLLFNTKGFVNVRLQHIADAAFVSIGHLAYHFKNKNALIENLYENIKNENEKLLNKHKVVPLFEDTNIMLQEVFQQQVKYSFFYTDILEIIRAYPALSEKHIKHIYWQRMQLSFMLRFNISRGALKMKEENIEPFAKLLQLYIDNWMHNSSVDPGIDQSIENFLKDVWLLISANFSHTGWLEFKQLQAGGNRIYT